MYTRPKASSNNLRPKVFSQGADKVTGTIEDDVMVKTIEEPVNTSDNHSHSPNQQPVSSASEMQTSFIDSLNLDEIAKQTEALRAIIVSTPDTNQTKVQFIKEELSAGRYQIHSNKIAEKLMEYSQSEELAEIV